MIFRRHPHVPGLFLGLLVPLTGCGDNPTGPELTDPRLFVAATAGGYHTCAITLEGRLLCWGMNQLGQLGDGTDQSRGVPTPVSSSSTFGQVAGGNLFTCALTSDGAASCWGTNDSGQLGVGTAGDERSQPTLVDTQLRFTSLAAGTTHACGLSEDGKAFCWGSDRYGQIGAEVADDCSGPCSRQPLEVETDLRFEKLTAGVLHTCGIARNGGLYCWGSNELGQLGVGTSELCDPGYDELVPCSTTPVRVSGGVSWESVTAGLYHNCALARSGTVHCWGRSEGGMLGDGLPPENPGFRTEPRPVTGGLKFKEVTAGAYHSCGVTTQGSAYCWGSGELGDGTGNSSPSPVPVTTSVLFSEITAGTDHTCGLALEGVLYCWGENRYGQLGDSSGAFGWPTPVAVKGW